ncbi:MAG: glyoxalase [Myxococcales bacterium]|nr:glyoxalase [Myxococcales bacterium]
MAINPVPHGYHTITPYIIASDANRLLGWLAAAFGAEVRHRTDGDDGTLQHAEVKVGDSMLMLSQGKPEYPGTPITIYMYVPDCDEVYKRALAAGGTSLSAPADQYYGDRNGGVKDPVGNSWYIGSRIEEVGEDEMKRRARAQKK